MSSQRLSLAAAALAVLCAPALAWARAVQSAKPAAQAEVAEGRQERP